MKAKTITNNLKWRNARRGNRGYSCGRGMRMYRGFIPNDTVLYMTKSGAYMSCVNGEYTMVKN